MTAVMLEVEVLWAGTSSGQVNRDVSKVFIACIFRVNVQSRDCLTLIFILSSAQWDSNDLGVVRVR